MKDTLRNIPELLEDVSTLKKRIRELEQSVEESRRTEEALRESEAKFRFLSENMADIAFTVDMDLRTTYVSPSVTRILGFTPEGRITQQVEEQMSHQSLQLVFETLMEEVEREKAENADSDRSRTLTLEYYHKDGSIKSLETNIRGIRDSKGVLSGFYGLSRDITERKKVEEALRREYSFRNAIIDNVAEGLCVCHETKEYPFINFTVWNNCMTKITGYTVEEINRLGWYQTVYPDPQLQAKAIERMKRMRHREDLRAEEWDITRADGNKCVLNISTSVVESDDGLVHILALMQDITERKRMEEEMVIISAIGTVIGSTLEIDTVYERVATEIRRLIPFDSLIVNLIDAQQEMMEVAYVSALDIPGRRVGDLFPLRGTVVAEAIRSRKGVIVQSENPEDLVDKFPSLIVSTRAGMRSIMSIPLITQDEVIGNLMIRLKKPAAYTEKDLRLAEKIGMQISGAIANARLFNNLSKMEKSLRETNELFSLFMRHSPVYAYIKEVTPTQSIILQATENYWQRVGIPGSEIVGKTMAELFPPEFAAKITAEDRAVVSSGDVLTLDEELNGRSYTTIKFPIVRGDATLLAGYTIDITDRKSAEKQLQMTLTSLRRAVNTTIQVMVSAVETRDPYTSGHQLRSADLARAIATEMGLPREKIEGIRIVASIHDIGKLSIPAEILSKPTKLSAIEFSLLKEHAMKGYEMLKDVESPWALAQIVYQHHERMDGSGYPRNLKGDAILMEARILAIADVVEAMASHRPYRPALGIGTALEEIEKNKGVLYDDAVADACLRLFREKGYQFKTA
jgi:PAS domain S-box-containing protein